MILVEIVMCLVAIVLHLSKNKLKKTTMQM